MQKHPVMIWVNIIKSMRKANFKCIYLKILTSSWVGGIRIINKSHFNVINKTTVSSCLEMSITGCLFMFFTPQDFPRFILVIIPPLLKFVISMIIIFNTIYLARQEVHQTFITRYKSIIKKTFTFLSTNH